jgi:hypothetical protein
MISVLGTTGNYVLQPALLEKHSETIDWLSSTILWKSELNAFQKILDERAPHFTLMEDKREMDDFQKRIIHYQDGVIDDLRKKLRAHEAQLASMLESKNELNTKYFEEHDGIMGQLLKFSVLFKQFRTEFLELIRKAR